MKSIGFILIAALACTGSKNDPGKREQSPGEATPGNSGHASSQSNAGIESAWDGKNPYKKPVISSTDLGFRIVVDRALSTGFPKGDVPYTAEPYNLMVLDGKPNVQENNLAGSGLAIDLNGDGDTDDQLQVGCKEGKLEIEGTTFEIVSQKTGEELYYPGEPRKIAGKGATLIQYDECDKAPVNIGLAPPQQETRLLKSSGPSLQIILFQQASVSEEIPELPINLRKDGKDIDVAIHRGMTNEPIFGKGSKWVAMHWAMVPLDDKAKQTIDWEYRKSNGKGMLLARVNVGIDGEKRLRFAPGIWP